MNERLKRRLVGAIVLVSLAIIFVPMMLDNRVSQKQLVSGIPSRDTGPFDEQLANARPTPITPINSTPEQVPPPSAQPIPEPAAQAPAVVVPAAPASAPPLPVSTGLSAWVVQVGSFSKREGADSTAAKLRKAGFDTVIEEARVSGNTVYRVQVGPEADKAQAEALVTRIKDKLKLDGKVMSYPTR